MTRHFDESPPGRMNFREIAQEVRRRSGNRRKPSDIQIVNAIGIQARERRAHGMTHSLVPPAFKNLAWDGANSIATEDAERWMAAHLVPYFAALKAEWDDRDAFKRRRKGFQRDRLAHMRKVGYTAFALEFSALHEERRTRKDVDGWLLKKFADTPDDIPEPEVAIPKKRKKVKAPEAPPHPIANADNAPVVMVIRIEGHPRLKFRPLAVEGPDWIEAAVLRSNQLVRLIGVPDAKPKKLPMRVSWPADMGRADDELVMRLREFHRGWGYQATMTTMVQ